MTRPGPTALVFVASLCALLPAARVAAEVVKGDVPVRPRPYEPPALTFPGNKISLVDALRLTLQNDPNIRLKAQESRLQAGAWEEQSGRFDPSLLGNFTYQLQQTSLSQSQVEAEKKKRTGVEGQIEDARFAGAEARRRVDEYGECSLQPDSCVISDPGELSQYRTLQELIRTAPDEKTRLDYIRVRNAFIASNLRAYQTAQQIATEEQAKKEEERRNLGDIPRQQQQQQLKFDATLLFPFRDGVTPGLFVRGDWSRDRFKGKDKELEKGGKGSEDVYSLAVGFSVDAPLLRGAGREAAAAFETAAHIDFDASRKALQHSATTALLNTTSAYWALVGAQENVNVARQSLGLQDRRLEVTNALIDAEELPRAEVSRVQAQQASDRGLLQSAERAMNEARVGLARAMGLTVQEDANAPYAADPFPPIADPAAFGALRADTLIASGLARRFDRQAFLLQEESGGVLLREAEIGLLPKLDFHGEISAGTVGEKSLSATADHWAAPSFQLGVQFEAPIGNHQRRGILLQRDATLALRAINTADLDRNIKAGIVQAYRSLEEAAAQVARTREAVDAYLRTVDAENERFRLGQSSLIDTILTQQLEVQAMFSLVAAQQAYATLLAQLRFEAGLFVNERGDDDVELRVGDLLTLPRPE